MRGRLKDLLRLSGGEWLLSFTTRDDPRKIMDKLKDAEISVEIKKYDPKRSLDANGFMWAMCADIGKAMYPPLSKEDVYRMAIRAVGVYTEVDVLVWDVPTVTRRWSTHGIGWFVDVLDDAGIGKKKLCLYYGSSTYSVGEMKTLLNWLVDQGEQMGIVPRMSKEEEERVLAQWGKASCKQNESVGSVAS